MTNKTFSPGTVIDSPWLNDVNDTVYDILGDGVDPPATKAAARTNLGLGSVATQPSNNIAITGGTITGTTITGNVSGTASNVTGTVAVANGGTGATSAANAVSNLGLAPVGFRAHKNGAIQAFPTGVQTQVTFPTEAFDVGGYFTANAWTPPAGRLISLHAVVALNTTVLSTGVLSISIFKNGVEFVQGTLVGPTALSGYALVASTIDQPNGTDVYTVRVFQNNAASLNSVSAVSGVSFSGAQC